MSVQYDSDNPSNDAPQLTEETVAKCDAEQQGIANIQDGEQTEEAPSDEEAEPLLPTQMSPHGGHNDDDQARDPHVLRKDQSEPLSIQGRIRQDDEAEMTGMSRSKSEIPGFTAWSEQEAETSLCEQSSMAPLIDPDDASPMAPGPSLPVEADVQFILPPISCSQPGPSGQQPRTSDHRSAVAPSVPSQACLPSSIARKGPTDDIQVISSHSEAEGANDADEGNDQGSEENEQPPQPCTWYQRYRKEVLMGIGAVLGVLLLITLVILFCYFTRLCIFPKESRGPGKTYEHGGVGYYNPNHISIKFTDSYFAKWVYALHKAGFLNSFPEHDAKNHSIYSQVQESESNRVEYNCFFKPAEKRKLVSSFM